MNKKGGLGKGLGAIFGENPNPIPVAEPPKEVKSEIKQDEADIKEIKANPYQPRRVFDEEKLQELADSIKEYGVVQPLVVRRRDNKLELVAGERRLRAAKLAGIKKVPILIRDYTDTQMMEIALVENIQRHDLNPIEEAQGIRQLMQECKLTQEQAATKIGRSRTAVTNILRLLNLAQPVQDYISKEILTMGQAKQLVGLPEKQQCEVAEAIIANGWSARIIEDVVRKLKDGQQVKVIREVVTALQEKNKSPKAAAPEEKKDVFCCEFENRLIELLGTKVKVLPRAKNKGGTIEIEYYSEDDLNRIYELLQEQKKQQHTGKTTLLHV